MTTKVTKGILNKQNTDTEYISKEIFVTNCMI